MQPPPRDSASAHASQHTSPHHTAPCSERARTTPPELGEDPSLLQPDVGQSARGSRGEGTPPAEAG
ncbi:hypothetical protein GCM10010359_16630 [Streptomyces morookaense]|nr:hypothetical protein GCM10010359_16630 [Streptomyces morookaense]